MATFRVNFGEEFIAEEEETFLLPPWEIDPLQKLPRLATRKWPIDLVFRLTHHRVLKPRSDFFDQPMVRDDYYWRIETYVCRIRTRGKSLEIRENKQSPREVFRIFKTTKEYEDEIRFFLWNVKARPKWRTSLEFRGFYCGSTSWSRAKTCIDCGATAKQIGLYDNEGRWNWVIVWDKPGQYRCRACWYRTTAEYKLKKALFGGDPPERTV